MVCFQLADVTMSPDHPQLPAHTTRFDDQAGPVWQFFLHYYEGIIVGLGLVLFGILWWRQRRRQPRHSQN
ncbi:MAG: hypothetical protein HYY50_00895 [Candidatus Kerfeldbacteria bacterium]|nr:hypothetical protein [Candidatus Kerfeldbacteria bacterium]